MRQKNHKVGDAADKVENHEINYPSKSVSFVQLFFMFLAGTCVVYMVYIMTSDLNSTECSCFVSLSSDHTHATRQKTIPMESHLACKSRDLSRAAHKRLATGQCKPNCHLSCGSHEPHSDLHQSISSLSPHHH